MQSITLDDVTISAWRSGVEIVQNNTTVFIPREAIGNLSIINEMKYSMVTYIPVHSHTNMPVQLASWYNEKVLSNNAHIAYEFIKKVLYL